jgi:hypothetical protein
MQATGQNLYFSTYKSKYLYLFSHIPGQIIEIPEQPSSLWGSSPVITPVDYVNERIRSIVLNDPNTYVAFVIAQKNMMESELELRLVKSGELMMTWDVHHNTSPSFCPEGLYLIFRGIDDGIYLINCYSPLRKLTHLNIPESLGFRKRSIAFAVSKNAKRVAIAITSRDTSEVSLAAVSHRSTLDNSHIGALTTEIEYILIPNCPLSVGNTTMSYTEAANILFVQNSSFGVYAFDLQSRQKLMEIIWGDTITSLGIPLLLHGEENFVVLRMDNNGPKAEYMVETVPVRGYPRHSLLYDHDGGDRVVICYGFILLCRWASRRIDCWDGTEFRLMTEFYVSDIQTPPRAIAYREGWLTLISNEGVFRDIATPRIKVMR